MTTPTPTTQTAQPTQTLGFMGGEQYNVGPNGAATAANAQGATALNALGVPQVAGTPTYTGYVPPKPAQYPVLTAEDAVKDLNSKKDSFGTIQQGMVVQQQANAIAEAAKAQQSAATAQTDAEKAKADALNGATTALTGSQPKSETTVALEDINAKADQAYEDYKSQIDSLRNGTFPLSPSDQAQIDYVKKQFDNLKLQQIQANKNSEGAMNQLGIVSGRSRYAPEIQTGLIQQTINDGIAKVADLEAQAANTVAQLQSAFEEKNYKRINDSYKTLQTYLSEKSKTINEIAQNVREEANLALAQHAQAYKEQQDELTRRDAAIKFAIDNKVTKPFYLVNNTAIDATTGEQIDLAEYQRRTGQRVGLPESETDFSFIQQDIETPEERQEKIRQEEFAYKKEQDAIANNFQQQQINISAGNLALSRARFAAETAAAGGNLPEGTSRAISLAVSGLKFGSVADRKAAESTIASLLSQGDIEAAKEQLQGYIRNSASATQQDVLDGKDAAIRNLDSIQQKLADFKAAGGNTNIFTGLSEKALEKGGFTKDPKLAGLANDIALSIIDYRRAVSGAAFTESEKKSYDAVFPSIGNTSELNQAKLDSLKAKFESDKESFYKQRVGADKYNQIFGSAESSRALDNYVKANPESLTLVAQIEKENPQYTDADILQIVQGSSSNNQPVSQPKASPSTYVPTQRKVGGLNLNL